MYTPGAFSVSRNELWLNSVQGDVKLHKVIEAKVKVKVKVIRMKVKVKK